MCYISHGGPGSGRYPLGSGERPYQKYEGTGKKFSLASVKDYIKSKLKKKSQTQTKSTINQQTNQAQNTQQSNQLTDEQKRKIIREGTADDVLKIKTQLTNNELQEAQIRLNLEKQLSQLSKEDREKAFKTVDDVVNKMSTVVGWANKGLQMYNTITSVSDTIKKAATKSQQLTKKK
jgi:hypothetical protein